MSGRITSSRRIRLCRSAFTLIEVTSSLAIITVLMIGMSSAFMLSTRAIPTDSELGIQDREIQAALATIRADFMRAADIKSSMGGSIQRVRIDLRTDGYTGEYRRVTYECNHDTGVITREVDSRGEVQIIDNMGACAFTPSMDGAEARYIKIFIWVKDTAQQFFEIHIALPDTPTVGNL